MAKKRSNTEPANENQLPPIYYQREQRSATIEVDPPAGALTEGKDIVEAFSALIHEGKASFYSLMRAIYRGDAIAGHGSWAAWFRERDGALGYDTYRYGFQAFRDPGTYGATYYRATRELVWSASIPRLCSDDEIAEGHHSCGEHSNGTGETLLSDTRKWCASRLGQEGTNEEVRRLRVELWGLPDMEETDLLKHYLSHDLPAWYTKGVTSDTFPAIGPDDPQFPPGSVSGWWKDKGLKEEELYSRWIDEFLDEVTECVGRFEGREELSREMTRFVDTLRDFEVGSGEAAPLIEKIRATAAGSRALTITKDGKNRLLERLGAIAASLPSETPSTVARTLQPIQWNDTAALLAYLLTELVEAEYITPPPNGRKTGKEGNRAAVADLAYQLLDIRDRSTNEPVTREYFRSLMRPSSPDRDSRPDLFKIRSRTARNEPT